MRAERNEKYLVSACLGESWYFAYMKHLAFSLASLRLILCATSQSCRLMCEVIHTLASYINQAKYHVLECTILHSPLVVACWENTVSVCVLGLDPDSARYFPLTGKHPERLYYDLAYQAITHGRKLCRVQNAVDCFSYHFVFILI